MFMVLTFHFVLKLKVAKSTMAALLSLIVLILAEWVTVLVQTRLLGFSEEQILGGSDLSKFLFSLPPLIIVIVFSLVLQLGLHYGGGRKNNKA